MQDIQTKIESRIFGNKRGWVFTPRRFFTFGASNAVAMALTRLVDAGTIRKLARGLYDYPKKHPVLGLLIPGPDAIAKAIAGKESIRLQPSGAYAANLLGLTEQVPARIIYLTDGQSRNVQVGKQTIQLKHTTPRNMATAGKLSGLVIQAFRHLGKNAVTDATVKTLRRRLKPDDRRALLKDLRHAPEWMHGIIRQIAED